MSKSWVYISILPFWYHHILGKTKLEYHSNRIPNKARNKRSIESNEEEKRMNEKRGPVESTNEKENHENEVEKYDNAVSNEEGTKRCKR